MDDWKSSKEALIAALQDTESPEQLDDATRARLAGLVDAVSVRTQSPIAFLTDLFQSPIRLVAARIGIAMGIFDAFAATKFEPMSTQELDAKTKGDEILLVRFLRILTSYHMVQQLDPQTWKATTYGAMLATEDPSSMVVIHFYSQIRCHAFLLEYLERTNFQNPNDYFDAPWGHAYGTDKGYFQWLEKTDNELPQRAFNTVMSMSKAFRGQDWFDHYPAENLLSSSTTTEDRVILVDIGGGLGQDVVALKKKFPDVRGDIVLQDLPKVIESIGEQTLPDGVKSQCYDAFTPQPVKNARIYYMRNVLHDWPDKQALQMLKNVRDAMGPDSVLLVNDNVMTEDNVSRIVTGIDLTLMNSFGAMERTERQWRRLLGQAGFDRVNVWYPTEHVNTPHAVFEATVQ